MLKKSMEFSYLALRIKEINNKLRVMNFEDKTNVLLEIIIYLNIIMNDDETKRIAEMFFYSNKINSMELDFVIAVLEGGFAYKEDDLLQMKSRYSAISEDNSFKAFEAQLDSQSILIASLMVRKYSFFQKKIEKIWSDIFQCRQLVIPAYDRYKIENPFAQSNFSETKEATANYALNMGNETINNILDKLARNYNVKV